MVGGEDNTAPSLVNAADNGAATTNSIMTADEDKTANSGMLRSWNHSSEVEMTATSNDGHPQTAPLGSFEDVNIDETPYEHGFQPGDHIIRWDMLPILWPIQIHGIVLEVSEDKTTVTICDFGITTVKNDAVEKKMAQAGKEKDVEKMLEEENAKFNEAIQDDGKGGTTAQNDGVETSAAGEEKQKESKNRLNIVILMKWSDLRKWKKVDYEGGLLNKGGGMSKKFEKLGKKTEKLWSSVSKSWKKESNQLKRMVRHVPSVRYDVNSEGYCVHHPEIQLMRRREDTKSENGQDDWVVVRKKCPKCILEDCPAMMGDSPPSRTSTVDSAPSVEEGSRVESTVEVGKTESNLSDSESIQPPSGLSLTRTAGNTPSVDCNNVSSDVIKSDAKDALDEPTTMAQMITKANDIDQPTERKPTGMTASRWSMKEQSFSKLSSWRQGPLVKSVTGLLSSQKNEKAEDSSNKEGQSSSEVKGKADESKANELPRSDPAVLVLARTRFILEHGEDILPPYHIINSNSECIAVW